MPGLGAGTAAANAPEQGVVGFKILHYRDYQPGGKRMTVNAPSVYVAKTLPGNLVVQGSYVLDSVSGASPIYHSTLSGASGKGIKDTRHAGDLKLTKYFDRFAIGVGGAYSDENDYRSIAGGLDLHLYSPSRNTTVTLGVGGSGDEINSVNQVAIDRKRNTTEYLLGITQVLTRNDIVQSNIVYSQGRGYYDDPYKAVDRRPDHRNQLAWLVRWNHHFDGLQATLRSSYRYYNDSFGVRGHTLAGEWAQGLPDRWTLVPSLRYYSQSAADFYFDPPFPSGFTGTNLYSADQRLSAFGAVAPGLKLIKEFAGGWIVDLKAEYYEQRGSWKLSGGGSPGLEPFKAQSYQFGIAKRF